MRFPVQSPSSRCIRRWVYFQPIVLLLLLLQTHSVSATELPTVLAPYQGQTIYIDFWASWCSPCRRAVPWLNSMQDRYGNGSFTIVGVNVDQDSAEAQRFLTANPVNYPVIYDPNGKLAEYFDIRGMPSTVILSRNGAEITRHIGFFSDKTEEYERVIQLVVKGK